MEQTQRPPVLKKESTWTPQRKYKRYSKKYSTYLGLIANVIQNSPNKMLTFGQLMESLSAFVSGERKGLENNVRVCLSSNDCFVKVPVNPDYPNARRNYWKVDESRITPKMLRRHFSGTRDILTGLSSRIPAESNAMKTSLKLAETQLPVLEDKRSSNFNSSFSIESLLKKDPEIRSLPTDDTGDVNFLRKNCVYSLKFGRETIKPTPSFRDYSVGDLQNHPQCGGLAYDPRESMRNGYTLDTGRLCKRARLSPPNVVYAAAGGSPFFHEHMLALKRWSLGANTFDSRSF
ncbi:forkhead box protein H1 [Alosa sapidissima]|uniref:forkhead box protein H1 n=1 Tax=Alosa sapidissima TaxID=34773 RepID=UPI001C096628|nr:forkhead box protein H1 [Alosa sapidissima]